MDLTITDDDLRQRAAEVLESDELLTSPEELFFDPAVPLREPPPLPNNLPTFLNLFGVVPAPYADRMTEAYVQMSYFAANWWPAIGGLVYAQPFFEWLMHADLFHPYYRDHIVHQVRVAAIGDLLLAQELTGRTLLTHMAQALTEDLAPVTSDPEGFLRRAWWFTALLHDCGYPYEHHAKGFNRLSGIYRAPISDPTSANWHACQECLTGRVGALNTGDLRHCRQARHSFIGAAELSCQEHEYVQKHAPKEDEEYRKRRGLLFALATRAILVHHAPPEGVAAAPVSFNANPLGYLLVLSDELHEMNRPLGRASVDADGRPQTVITYEPSPVTSADLSVPEDSNPPALEVQFTADPEAEEISGRSPEAWVEDKQGKLTPYLKCGDGELFGEIRVLPVHQDEVA